MYKIVYNDAILAITIDSDLPGFICISGIRSLMLDLEKIDPEVIFVNVREPTYWGFKMVEFLPTKPLHIASLTDDFIEKLSQCYQGYATEAQETERFLKCLRLLHFTIKARLLLKKERFAELNKALEAATSMQSAAAVFENAAKSLEKIAHPYSASSTDFGKLEEWFSTLKDITPDGAALPLIDLITFSPMISRSATSPQRIIVIGRGPAGLYASLLLARDGHALTVIDKRDEYIRPQVVGLSSVDRSELYKIMAFDEELIRELNILFSRKNWTLTGNPQFLGLPVAPTYPDDIYIQIKDLERCLFRALKKFPHVTLRTVSQNDEIIIEQERPEVIVKNNQGEEVEKFEFDLVVDAEGASKKVAQSTVPANELATSNNTEQWVVNRFRGAAQDAVPFNSESRGFMHCVGFFSRPNKHGGVNYYAYGCNMTVLSQTLDPMDTEDLLIPEENTLRQLLAKNINVHPDSIERYDQPQKPEKSKLAKQTFVFQQKVFKDMVTKLPSGKLFIVIGDALRTVSPTTGNGIFWCFSDAILLEKKVRILGNSQFSAEQEKTFMETWNAQSAHRIEFERAKHGTVIKDSAKFTPIFENDRLRARPGCL